MDQKVEIIVLKKADGPEEKKKGGAWKVAHADFMTAMMAFFLIMWLVNATDEEIKKSIANYFNPMNLMAAPTDRRGILDPSEDVPPPASGEEQGQNAGTRPLAADSPGDGSGHDGGGNVEQGNQNTMASAGILNETDGPEFNDPYADLASEASDIDPEVPTAVDVTQTTIGAQGVTTQSEEHRDPFDPAYWQAARRRDERTLRPGNPETLPALDTEAAIDAADASPTGPTRDPARDTAQTAEAEQDADATEPYPVPRPRSSVAEAIIAALAPDAQPDDGETLPRDTTAQDETAATSPAASALVANIEAALADTGAEVSVDESGAAGNAPIVISLTDEQGGLSMFPIGSAVPNPDAVAVFASVAEALSDLEGAIIVRGHTDARPFRSGRSDNWVLSFQRAHATKEALTANGVAESRIRRVEGLADREPSRPEDPLASENRRIEVLYQPPEVPQ